jgi:pimeloyl-ACP methyl ester carboxylesterase
VLSLLTGGCILRAIRDGVESAGIDCTIAGEVRAPAGWGRTTVVLMRESPSGELTVEAAWPSFRPGRFSFLVRPGAYRLAAFRNREDGTVPQEPASWATPHPDGDVRVGKSQTASAVVLSPGGEGTAAAMGRLRTVVARARLPAPRRLGDVVSMADPRFGHEAGRLALWSPGLFVERFGWGLYLLQPWDPSKIPVVLVHGAGGYPQQWQHVVAALDGTRFQPILFQYPSGARLQSVADCLTDMLEELRDRLAFRELVVVAHSMGGLVTRKAIGRDSPASWPREVRLLVTIAAPWQGVEEAQRGLGESPYVIPSWMDMAPGSEFLRTMRQSALPSRTSLALLFGFRRGSKFLPGESSDHTVTLRSILDPEAQAEASLIRGFNEDHESILASPEVLTVLQGVLAKPPGG